MCCGAGWDGSLYSNGKRRRQENAEGYQLLMERFSTIPRIRSVPGKHAFFFFNSLRQLNQKLLKSMRIFLLISPELGLY